MSDDNTIDTDTLELLDRWARSASQRRAPVVSSRPQDSSGTTQAPDSSSAQHSPAVTPTLGSFEFEERTIVSPSDADDHALDFSQHEPTLSTEQMRARGLIGPNQLYFTEADRMRFRSWLSLGVDMYAGLFEKYTTYAPEVALPDVTKQIDEEDDTKELRLAQLQHGDCPICAEPFDKPYETPCGHVFCGKCVGKWLSSNDTCPTCRRGMTMSQMVLLVE